VVGVAGELAGENVERRAEELHRAVWVLARTPAANFSRPAVQARQVTTV